MVYGKVKRLAPRWLKRPVKEALLRRQLRGAIRSIENLAPGQVPDRRLLSELIVGWSNDGFVANLKYLEEVAKRSVDTKGPILECGTGITTILMGILCGKRKVDVWVPRAFSPVAQSGDVGITAQRHLASAYLFGAPRRVRRVRLVRSPVAGNARRVLAGGL
jgi:hypothetical protein